ncbi:MAG: ROK family protein [Clostridia bacterium]|nr:ROK family protein [Clostridia bacterium]
MRIEKLYPECKDNLWGGTKLKERYGKITDASPCAESWELSFHPDGPTKLENGTHLSQAVTANELGTNLSGFDRFPMLIKFIDAAQDLSIQVHPSDSYALKHENSLGKTEMWYVVEADEGAGLYLGFKSAVTQEEYESAIREKRLTDLLNFYPVHAGDVYFIPSGTIHAIASGCLICEIQQNSNLTYRVYDYGRVDKNGKERELHVEQALKVTDLSPYAPATISARTEEGELLAANKYFTVSRLEINQKTTLRGDRASFRALTCVRGNGTLCKKDFKQGDTYFLSACDEEYELDGDMTVIISSLRKYYVGIDLGGTFIKGGIVDDLGRLIVSDKIPTEREGGDLAVARNIAKLTNSLLSSLNLTAEDAVGVGIGVPGMIDSANGEVVYSNNLGWKNFKIGKTVEELTSLPVKIANDANVAALGETKFGSGRNYRTTVMLTLGTGVGGGIVLDGKLFEGNRSAGAELGHSVICMGGERCTCGRRGCLEAYASATGLIRDTKRAMEADKASKMWEIGALDAVDGSTAFRYSDVDASAKRVVDSYIAALACGITNLANELRPEAILLGGGVCAEGERLTKPLQSLVNEEIFAGSDGPAVPVLTAALGNRAGILGAAALLLDQ